MDFYKKTYQNDKKTFYSFDNNDKAHYDSSDIYSALDDFLVDPYDLDKINLLIEISEIQPFLVLSSFFDIVIHLFHNNTNIEQCIYLLTLITKFPIDNFIENIPYKEIVECLLSYTNVSPDAIKILTFFLQNIELFPDIDKIYLELYVVQNVKEQLDNEDQQIIIQSLIFFRYLLKTDLPFLEDITCIYNKIIKLAVNSISPINIFSIHTLYHYSKKYIRFHKKNKNKIKDHDQGRHSLRKNMILPDLFMLTSELQIDNCTFLFYLLKIFLNVTRIKKIYRYHSEKILLMAPILLSSLQEPNEKIVKSSLSSIYNILRDGRDKAYNDLLDFNVDILNCIFQNYYQSGYTIQKEIIFVFIEYSYYMCSDDLFYFFKEYDLINIFVDLLSSDDNELLEDLFLCFSNIFDTFAKENFDYLKFFQDDSFVIAIQSTDPECSSFFPEFREKLDSIL